METIGRQKLWSFREGVDRIKSVDCTKIRESPGYEVRDYLDLARRVAELQFYNREFVLLFKKQLEISLIIMALS